MPELESFLRHCVRAACAHLCPVAALGRTLEGWRGVARDARGHGWLFDEGQCVAMSVPTGALLFVG